MEGGKRKHDQESHREGVQQVPSRPLSVMVAAAEERRHLRRGGGFPSSSRGAASAPSCRPGHRLKTQLKDVPPGSGPSAHMASAPVLPDGAGQGPHDGSGAQPPMPTLEETPLPLTGKGGEKGVLKRAVAVGALEQDEEQEEPNVGEDAAGPTQAQQGASHLRTGRRVGKEKGAPVGREDQPPEPPRLPPSQPLSPTPSALTSLPLPPSSDSHGPCGSLPSRGKGVSQQARPEPHPAAMIDGPAVMIGPAISPDSAAFAADRVDLEPLEPQRSGGSLGEEMVPSPIQNDRAPEPGSGSGSDPGSLGDEPLRGQSTTPLLRDRAPTEGDPNPSDTLSTPKVCHFNHVHPEKCEKTLVLKPVSILLQFYPRAPSLSLPYPACLLSPPRAGLRARSKWPGSLSVGCPSRGSRNSAG